MLTIKINDLLEISNHTDILKSNIKVNTPNGMKKIHAVGITSINSDLVELKTKKHELICSPSHLIKYNNNWGKVKEYRLGDKIDTKQGEYEIKYLKKLDYKEDLLDLQVEGSEYYTNDIVSHNSSLLDSFDYVLYGKVRGKKKKWTTLATLPNRINGELCNRIKFKSGGTEIEVKRGISPSILNLIENGVENKKAGKANIEDKIEKYIGLDIETFKSFISMSINDFKNFISLSNEEKQLLLDKLFNLEVINILNNILKDLNKTNKLQIARLDSEINALGNSITSIEQSIQRAIEKQKEDIQQEIDVIIEAMDSKKDEYKDLKDKIEKVKQKDTELNEEMRKERDQLISIKNDIRSAQKDIDLYDSGKCPTCGTDFDNDHFHNLKGTLVQKKESLEKIKDEIEGNIQLIIQRQSKLMTISETVTSAYNDLTYLLRGYKSQIDSLSSKKESEESNANIDEFRKTIQDLNEKKSLSEENFNESKDKEIYYKELNRIFGEDGVKKTIIAGIIKPINHFIAENIRNMGLPFQVKLDETFTAEIRQFGNVIDHESLSTGETKLINLNILVAYLKLIRTKKHINILFLDEVFSSIDIENIEKILSLLKSFANDYNINIFVVHHAILNQELFDRIIKINKDVFTTFEEIDYEE